MSGDGEGATGPGPVRILETCLYAADVDRCADFYATVFGFPVTGRAHDRHVFLRCGDGMLLIFNPSATERSGGEVPPHGARGPGHVAFAVHEGRLPHWRDHLDRLGVEVEREVSWPRGGSSLYLRDPAGNSVEVTTPRIWGMDG